MNRKARLTWHGIAGTLDSRSGSYRDELSSAGWQEQGPRDDEGEGPSSNETTRRASHSKGHRRIAEVSTGLEGMLPASGYTVRLR
jgi:hypothetical protein